MERTRKIFAVLLCVFIIIAAAACAPQSAEAPKETTPAQKEESGK